MIFLALLAQAKLLFHSDSLRSFLKGSSENQNKRSQTERSFYASPTG